MKVKKYDILAWIFAAVSAAATYFAYEKTLAVFKIEWVSLLLGISICGIVFSINAAKSESPKRFFVPPLILSIICTWFNGRVFLACVMLNVMCGGLPFLLTHG